MLFVSVVYAQGISFFSGSWSDVLAEAKQKKKVVFVDIYTEWCGPCKLMEKNIFPDEQVGKYYNANFICFACNGCVFAFTYSSKLKPKFFASFISFVNHLL